MERELNEMDKTTQEITEFDQTDGTAQPGAEGTAEADAR